MIIRKAAPGDRDILIELRGLMLESMMSDKLQEDDLKTIRQYFWEWDGEDPFCLVAEEEGPVVGSIAASFYNHFPGPGDPSGIRAIIHNLCVLPDHRGERCSENAGGKASAGYLYMPPTWAGPSSRASASQTNLPTSPRCACMERILKISILIRTINTLPAAIGEGK
jgi:hypothetical protein